MIKTNSNLSDKRRMKLYHGATEKVQETGGDCRMTAQTLIHDKNTWFDVHDAVLLRGIKKPIPKESEVTIGRSDARRARG